MRHGCHNRPPLHESLTVQDGWTEDGRRITRTLPAPMSKLCQHDKRDSDPGCAGCRWRDAVAG